MYVAELMRPPVCVLERLWSSDSIAKKGLSELHPSMGEE